MAEKSTVKDNNKKTTSKYSFIPFSKKGAAIIPRGKKNKMYTVIDNQQPQK